VLEGEVKAEDVAMTARKALTASREGVMVINITK